MGPPLRGRGRRLGFSQGAPYLLLPSCSILGNQSFLSLSFQPEPHTLQLGLFGLRRLIPSAWQMPGLEGHCRVL